MSGTQEANCDSKQRRERVQHEVNKVFQVEKPKISDDIEDYWSNNSMNLKQYQEFIAARDAIAKFDQGVEVAQSLINCVYYVSTDDPNPKATNLDDLNQSGQDMLRVGLSVIKLRGTADGANNMSGATSEEQQTEPTTSGERQLRDVPTFEQALSRVNIRKGLMDAQDRNIFDDFLGYRISGPVFDDLARATAIEIIHRANESSLEKGWSNSKNTLETRQLHLCKLTFTLGDETYDGQIKFKHVRDFICLVIRIIDELKSVK